MSDTDTEDRYQRPDPSSSYTQSGDPASFAGGYAGATPGSSKIASLDAGSAPDPIFDRAAEQLKPAQGQVGWQPYDGEDRVQQDPAATTPFGFRQLTSASPYIPTAMNPALRDRRANDWATPDYITQGMTNYPDGGMPEGQYMPTEADIPGIIHNATMTLGRFGPPSIGMPMVTAGRSWLAGMKNYQQGAMQAAQLNERQAKLQFAIADRRLEEMLRKYSNVFATFGPDESGKDYNADRLHEEVTRIAHEYGDSYMLNLVNTKDWGAVDRHLKHLDGTGQDLKKTQLLLEREKVRKAKSEADAAEAENKRFGIGEETATTPPARAAQPGQPPQPGQPVPPVTERSTEDDGVPVAATPQMARASQDVQMGGKPADHAKSPAARTAIEDQAQKLNDYMNGLIDKNISPGDMRARVRAANPQMGNMVDQLLDGQDLTKAGASRQSMVLAQRIAKKIDPDYEQNSRKIREQRDLEARRADVAPIRAAVANQEKMRSTIRGLVVKNVHDMNLLMQAAERLKAAGLDSQIPVINEYVRKGTRYFTDNPDLAQFEAQLRTVQTDAARILTTSAQGTGAVTVHAQEEMERLFPMGTSYRQLKAITEVLKRDYGNKLRPITDQVNELHGRIHEIQKGTEPWKPVNDDDVERALSADDVKNIGGKNYYLRDGKWHDE